MTNSAKVIRFIGKTDIQDVNFRLLINDILKEKDLKGIIYNTEDGNANIYVWGDDDVINNSLSQIKDEAMQKNIMFESEIENLSINTPPPPGVFILDTDTEKDKERKLDKGLARLNSIAKDVRDIITIFSELRNTSFDWNCRRRIITKENYKDFIKIDIGQVPGNIVIDYIKLHPICDCIKIPTYGDYGIKLILKDGEENIQDDAEIIVWRQTPSDPNKEQLANLNYGQLKSGKFKFGHDIHISDREYIAFYFEKWQAKKGIILADFEFVVDVCTNLKKERTEKELNKKYGF
jgi:acylphosphatase